MADEIADVMREEHKRLALMLGEVIVSVGKKAKDGQKKFIEFKWNVEKHFFVEEKAIFEAYTEMVTVGSREVNLIDEHDTMRMMMQEFSVDLDKGEFPDFTDFRTLLLSHQKKEDDYFYTGLENNLNEEEKAEIIDKINEIITG